MKHTDLPWNAFDGGIYDSDGFEILEEEAILLNWNSIPGVNHWSDKPGITCKERTLEEVKANAEFIVRACNSHDELLEALKNAKSALHWSLAHLDRKQVITCLEEIDRVFAKATGENS